MIRVYHVLLGFILIPVGVATGISYYSADKHSEASSLKTPSPTLLSTKSAATNIWENVIEEAALPPGWEINPCKQNNTSLLCVSGNGKLLGTVEMEILPLERQPYFQKMLLDAGIPPNSNINYQSPKYTIQVATALNLWVTNHYTELAKSRKYAYTDKLKTAKTADAILFSPFPLQKAQVGRLEGVRYGFVGLKQNGGVYEQHTGYVAFDGKAIYLINTAFAPDLTTGKFENFENLSVFEPYLNAIVANLKLPK
ncbi:MAG: hypothetical protein HC836_07145 [Richelia sp. RM2_1_2]|nr:hypothetical protein [Richelia sp. SM2_1_7]NJM18680.1 hypothetical protein [Richelia sp. SM1_7_0]NJN06896.1 hypothetical protein [Richelia sp. RM1_1_1]NJO26173.1 hypothetical protein [Richelia sp. SL_2_1]NJO58131.1 hypothetical protein [Richelia sp. RM2_1_2]